MPLVELIYDADCPNAAAARANLLQDFAAADMPACWREWDRQAPDRPDHVKALASPTILVDGRDVVHGPAPCHGSAACRLYRDEHGKMTGAPTVQVIADALRRA